MKVLAPGPGRYWTVLPVDAEAKALRPDVTIDCVYSYLAADIDPL